MGTIQGMLRADRRTKDLVKRLRPGDIALVHHADIDATAARALVDCRVAAVVNAVRSVSGRYPNRGPNLLLEAGIPVLDGVGEEFFAKAGQREGQSVVLDGDSLRFPDGFCGCGSLLTREALAAQLEAARANLSKELDSFARNTLEYLVEEKALLLDPVDVPDVRTPMRGRHVLIVVRGEGFKEDLRSLPADYLPDVRPVLIGVDGGADALMEWGLKPDIIIGDMDSVTDATLRCGAEIIVHGYSRGDRRAPGLDRVQALGLTAQVFHVPGTSEDAAMLLADEKGASLMVAVGTHFSLVEFLDKGRSGMASTFLVRLRCGSKLVDAKGLGRLWAVRYRSTGWLFVGLMISAMCPIVAIALYSPLGRTIVDTVRLSFRSAFGPH